MWAMVIIFIAIGVVLALSVIYRYVPFSKTRWYVLLFAFFGWVIAFVCPLLFPIDLVSTFNNEENLFHASEGLLKFLWWTIYIAQFGLCYCVFPILQTYSIVGDFNFMAKLKRSIKRNVFFYGFFVVLLVIFFVIFWLSKGDNIIDSGSEYLGFAMALCNVWGLFLAMALMGNGYASFSFDTLRTFTLKMYFKKLMSETGLYHLRSTETKRQIGIVMQKVKKFDKEVKEEDRPNLRANIDKCVKELREYDNDAYEKTRPESHLELSVEEFALIHEKMMDVLHKINRETVLFEKTKEKAIKVFYVVNDSIPGMKHKIKQSMSTMEYIYFKYLRNVMTALKVLLIVCFWVFVIWPELTMLWPFSTMNPDIAIASMLIKSDNTGWLGILTLLMLLMMTFFAFSSFLHIEMISFFRITKYHLSDSYSIIFSSNYLSRVGPSLALNVIHLLQFNEAQHSQSSTSNDHTYRTVFQDVNNGMENIPFFGKDFFYNSFPIIIIFIIIISILFQFIDYRRVFNKFIGALNTMFACVDGIGIEEIIYTPEYDSQRSGRQIIKKLLAEDLKQCPEGEFKNEYRKRIMMLKASKKRKEEYIELVEGNVSDSLITQPNNDLVDVDLKSTSPSGYQYFKAHSPVPQGFYDFERNASPSAYHDFNGDDNNA